MSENIINQENTSQNNTTSNYQTNNTKIIKPILKTGSGLRIVDIILALVIVLIVILILKNNQLTKKPKILLSIVIIVIGIVSIFEKYVFASSDDKIYINKKDKNILVVLSTANKTRNMTTQEFINKTKATELSQNILSGATATFKNNEKYTVKILADENNNGYVNSGDIFELLNIENIDTSAIEVLCNFIIKKEELKNYNNIPNRYEEFNENSIVTPSTTPLEPAQDRYTTVKNVEELKNTDVKVGDKYKTLGYYTENDGGAGRDDIIEKDSNITIDNGLYIELNNGLLAKLAIINETVNVKQFGAKENEENDDTQYLRTAFNSGVANIDMPKCEYKITDRINLTQHQLI